MKNIYYLAIFSCTLVMVNSHAMFIKNLRRSSYSTKRRCSVDSTKDKLKDLLQKKHNTNRAIIMLKRIQQATNHQKGDIYPLSDWNFYLALKGIDGEQLAWHSSSFRETLLEQQENSRQSIDSELKCLINPYGNQKKSDELDVLLQKSALMQELLFEEDIIRDIKSAKIYDKCVNSLLYKTLYPKKSVLKALFKNENRIDLNKEFSDLEEKINVMAMEESRN